MKIDNYITIRAKMKIYILSISLILFLVSYLFLVPLANKHLWIILLILTSLYFWYSFLQLKAISIEIKDKNTLSILYGHPAFPLYTYTIIEEHQIVRFQISRTKLGFKIFIKSVRKNKKCLIEKVSFSLPRKKESN